MTRAEKIRSSDGGGLCLTKKGRKSKKTHRARLRTLKGERTPHSIPKTKHACIVKAHESTRQRLESSLTKKHEDHIAGKGYTSMTHYNLFHKFTRMPQAMKIWDQKQQWTRNGRSWRQLQPGSWESKKQEGDYTGSTKKQKESPLFYTD